MENNRLIHLVLRSKKDIYKHIHESVIIDINIISSKIELNNAIYMELVNKHLPIDIHEHDVIIVNNPI